MRNMLLTHSTSSKFLESQTLARLINPLASNRTFATLNSTLATTGTAEGYTCQFIIADSDFRFCDVHGESVDSRATDVAQSSGNNPALQLKTSQEAVATLFR